MMRPPLLAMNDGKGPSTGRRKAVSHLLGAGALAAGDGGGALALAAYGAEAAPRSSLSGLLPGSLARSCQPLAGDLRNPERGLVEWAGNLLDDYRCELLDRLVATAGSTSSMVRWTTDLGLHGYLHKATIPNSALHRLSDNLACVKRHGLKAVVRFMYSYPRGAQDYRNPPHPPLEWMLGHIRQLGPVLQAHRELIAFTEAGFIGAWGEWHSTELLDTPGPRTRVRDQLLASFPGTILFCVPSYVREWYGESIVSEDGGSPEGRRIGLHNDSILSLKLHNGNTWRTSDFRSAGPQADHTDDRLYVRRLSRYRPYGGEVAPGDPAPYILRMSDPADHATQDLRLHHFQYLNTGRGLNELRAILDARDPAFFPGWIRQLGYRFVLLAVSCDEVAEHGQPFRLALRLRNEGASRIMHPRALQLRFLSVSERDVPDREAHDVVLGGVQPWRWTPGQDGDSIIDSGPIEVALAPGMKPGIYDLGLRMPDPDPTLARDSRYSVRPANADSDGAPGSGVAQRWDAASGTFMLGLRVRVI